MPETIKPEDQDQDRGSSDMPNGHPAEGEAEGMQTPGMTTVEGEAISASETDLAAHLPEQPAAEGSHSPVSEEEPDDFAASVVSGLEQLELEELDTLDLAQEAAAETQPQEAFFAGWDGLDIPETPAAARSYRGATDAEHDPALRTLSELGLASATLLSGFASAPVPEAGKHDELADAVQAALQSVYGASAHQEAPPQSLSFREEALGWQTPPSPSPSPSPSASETPDSLSPQDVILNYFDYNPANSNGNGRVQDNPESQQTQAWRRPPPGPAPQQQYGVNSEMRAIPEPSAQFQAPASAYKVAPAFPLPVAPANSSRAIGAAERESSRLLGAAAIGLIGGIAIAASLAAFLIYSGAPQATFDVPGVGNFRLDKDDQGYGHASPEESVGELARSSIAQPAPEYTSEVVAANVVMQPGQFVPLAISIRSPFPFERTLVSITGLPEGGRLSAGIDAGGGNWLLPPRRLNGLALSLPAGAPETVPLEVQLLDSNIRTPLSAKSQFVIRVKTGPAPTAAMAENAASASPLTVTDVKPASPPLPPSYALSAQSPALPAQTMTAALAPVQAPASLGAPAETNFKTQTVKAAPSQTPFQATLAPVPSVSPALAARRNVPRPEVEDLIREGNKRMREGDILEARQFYQRAVSYGDAEAALAMGRSYDPIYFARIDKKNAEPDAAKAFDWYRKAMDAGAAQTAMVRIENLKHFLNE